MWQRRRNQCNTRPMTALGSLLIVTALVLAGCGGGGGGGGDSGSGGGSGGGGGNPPPPAPAATETYLFYSGSLTALDPLAPSAPITVDIDIASPMSGMQPIVYGTYDAAARSLSDLHNRSIVYAKGANLFKVSAVKGAMPAATPLSSEATIPASGICDTYVAPDYADHVNARYVYALAGGDGDCGTDGDNVWKMVRVGMGAADAPRLISVGRKPIAEIIDPATGAVTGWLMLQGTQLVKLDANFANVQVVANGVNAVAFAGRAPAGQLFLRLDSLVAAELKRYDPATNALSGALHSFTGSLGSPLADGTHLYFLDGSAKILRLALDGASSAAEFWAEGGTRTIAAMALTTNRVVFVVRDSATDTDRLSSKPKLGNALVLVLKTAPVMKQIDVFGAAGTRVYYQWGDHIASAEIAASVLEDGSGAIEYAAHRFSGFTLPLSMPLGAAPALAQVMAIDISVTPRVLAVYDGPGHTPVSTHALPAGVNSILVSGLTNAGYVLGTTSFSNGDIFLLNIGADNSAIRITDTPGVSERVVGGCTLNPAGNFDPILVLMLLVAVWYLWRPRTGAGAGTSAAVDRA